MEQAKAVDIAPKEEAKTAADKAISGKLSKKWRLPVTLAIIGLLTVSLIGWVLFQKVLAPHPVEPTIPVITTPTQTPITPTINPSPTPPVRTTKLVGYITYWHSDLLPLIKLDQLTHLIWQSIEVTNGTDATLRVSDGYPWDQVSQAVALGHANNIKVLACLGGPWDSSHLNEIWASPVLRKQLITNLKDLVVTYNLDGIDIDNESSPDPALYSTFIAELYEVLNPLGKIITIAGNPYTVNITPEAAACLDFISLMTYDMYHGVGYPFHSTYDESVQAMYLWAGAGIPGPKLLMGIPLYGRDASTNFFFYHWIVDKYSPTPDQNQVSEPLAAGGVIWWNGIDLAKQKADFIKKAGFGGIMLYELGNDKGIDKPDDRSLLLTIYNQLNK